jgi:hypothetical protein
VQATHCACRAADGLRTLRACARARANERHRARPRRDRKRDAEQVLCAASAAHTRPHKHNGCAPPHPCTPAAPTALSSPIHAHHTRSGDVGAQEPDQSTPAPPVVSLTCLDLDPRYAGLSTCLSSRCDHHLPASSRFVVQTGTLWGVADHLLSRHKPHANPHITPLCSRGNAGRPRSLSPERVQ